jgi:hypothetical protein
MWDTLNDNELKDLYKIFIEALFRSKFFWDFDIIALSFLFDKHYPIIK